MRFLLTLLCIFSLARPISAQSKASTWKPIPPTPAKILKHIRSNEGIPLPTPEEINRPRSELPKFDFMEKTKEYRKKIVADFIKRSTELKPIPTCKFDKTEESQVNEKMKPFLAPDTLYIRPEEIPLDAREAFGEKVVLRKFRAEKPDMDTFVISTLKIPCLPYRVRIAENTIYRQQGIDALKNYDKENKGELVDQVKFLMQKKGRL